MSNDKSITVKMPFVNINSKSEEVEITSEKIIYSEIDNLKGIQVDDESIKKDAFILCKEISSKVKKLNKLLNPYNNE